MINSKKPFWKKLRSGSHRMNIRKNNKRPRTAWLAPNIEKKGFFTTRQNQEFKSHFQDFTF